MRRSKMILTVFALVLLMIGWGCSGGGSGDVIAPEITTAQSQNATGTGLWGLYQVSIDPDTLQVDITSVRSAELKLNVLGFMEPPALTNLSIDFGTLVIDDVAETIAVDVIFTHPLDTPENVFHGFDVRGICIGPAVTNTDGKTATLNPAMFNTVPFGYADGLLGAPHSYGQYDGIWDYKYFCDGLGLNDDLATFMSSETNLTNRGIFSEGTTNMRHYDLDWTNAAHDFFVFNYAVLASYDWPVGDPPFDLDNFNLTSANCQEPFAYSVTEVDNTLNWWDPNGTGAISLDIEMWDWQGNISNTVTVEAPAGGLTTTPSDSMSAGTTSKSDIFNFVDLAVVPTSTADIEFVITATSEATFGSSWFMDLFPPGHSMYDVNCYTVWTHSAPVGNEEPAGGNGLIVKSSGNLPAGDLPFPTDVEFCIRSVTQPGVYFFGNNHTVRYYPITYGASTLWRTLAGNYGYPVSGLCGAANTLGQLEVDESGGLVITSNGTGTSFGSYLQNQVLIWWDATNPALSNALTLSSSWGNVRSDDVEAEWTPYSPVWHHWSTIAKFNSTVEVVQCAIGSPYNSGAYGPYWNVNWAVLDEVGNVDGQVAMGLAAQRLAVDPTPQGLSGGMNVIFYYLEHETADKIEVYANVKTSAGAGQTSLTTIAGNFVGTPVDICVLNIFGVDADATGNWLCVLEDNGDSTWQVALFDQAGTLIDRSAVQTGDVVDSNNDAYGIDVDSAAHEVHVWDDNAGTLAWTIFEWSP